MKSIYALLVGIDRYAGNVSNLAGCVNDVTLFKEYLENRKDDDVEVHTKLLINENATHQAILKGFESLKKAQQGDVALFYYAGHGSQEEAPKEFWDIEPDHLNETLVCHDSRLPGHVDLADKELRYLISQVAKDGVHVSVILDCCHSSSGTRDPEEETVNVRLTSRHSESRPLEKYCFYSGNGTDLEAIKQIPEGKHITLAACQDNELAKEYNQDGKQWGAFSYFLRKTLESSKRSLSYHELLSRVRAKVQNTVNKQHPQINVVNKANPKEEFLGGVIKERTSYLVKYSRQKWILDAGSVHGISLGSNGEQTELVIFEQDSDEETLNDPQKALATAIVTKVSPGKSELKIILNNNEELSEGQYEAVITKFPLPPLTVLFTGDEQGIKQARQALGIVNDGKPSAFVREDKAPKYILDAKDDMYLIKRSSDTEPLVREIKGGYKPETARDAIKKLEHIARWQQIVELDNPNTRRLKTDDVKLLINGEELTEGELLLHYTDDEDFPYPSFTLSVKLDEEYNRATLHCAVMELSESFAIGVLDLPSNRLEPKEAPEIKYVDEEGDNHIYMGIPEELRENGITERKDVYKLIISTNEFDPYLLTQAKLEEYQKARGAETSTRSIGGTLDGLMKYAQTREIIKRPKIDDWFTKTITITTVAPSKIKALSSTQSTELRAGDSGQVVATLEPHSELVAKVSLASENETVRGLRSATEEVNRDKKEGEKLDIPQFVPGVLDLDPTLSEAFSKPFSFTTAQGADPGLSVIKLDDVKNPEAVNEENPLKVNVSAPLKDNEYLLPITFDGEFYLPLGYTNKENDQTQVIIESLPPNPKEGTKTRRPGASINLYFRKMIANASGKEFNLSRLTKAGVRDDGEVFILPNEKLEDLKDDVAKADRILLVIHGILGSNDNKHFLANIHKHAQKVTVNGEEKNILDTYDLKLTYDYENLNTEIQTNAEILRDKLATIYLGPEHGKTLDIVAHSMGGLVSRWFIERLDGNNVVSQLVMLGTPNAGSPWAAVSNAVFGHITPIKNWLRTMSAMVMNNILVTPNADHTVSRLSELSSRVGGRIDRSLDQMSKDSSFIKELAESLDPNCPYTLIAGDVLSQKASEDDFGEELVWPQKQLKRLWEALGLVKDNVVTVLLFRKPNDLAVSVESIKSITAERQPAPKIYDTACDHLHYFENEESLRHLVAVLEPNNSSS